MSTMYEESASQYYYNCTGKAQGAGTFHSELRAYI